MGRGKGNPAGWIARVSIGQIPFEMDGALVMLYMSPNKQRTNVSVKHFVNVCKDGLLSPVYQEMLAPVVLHFCVLLRTITSKIALYDIFPLVDELAYKLSNDLVESVNSVIGPSETHVRDFKAFVWFLLAALVDPMAFESLIPVHYHHNHP
nr:ribosomal protein L16, mitochondrial [Tanacetum cinerariifolium]